MESFPQHQDNYVLAFNRIVDDVKTHYRHLLEHKKYISEMIEKFTKSSKIESNEEGKKKEEKKEITMEDVNDYLRDVHHIRLKSSDKLKETLLVLEENLKSRLDETFLLNKVMKIAGVEEKQPQSLQEKNSPQRKLMEKAISKLAIALEEFLAYAKCKKQTLKSKDAGISLKVLMSFSDYDYLEYLNTLVQPLLPSCYDDLRKLISFTPKQEFVKLKKQNVNSFMLTPKINWMDIIRQFNKLNSLVNEKYNYMLESKEVKPKQKMKKIEALNKLDEQMAVLQDSLVSEDFGEDIYSKSIMEATFKIGNLILHNQSSASAANVPEKVMDLIDRNIAVFFEVHPLLVQYKKELNEDKKAREVLIKRSKEHMNEVEETNKNLKKSYDAACRSVKSIPVNELTKECLEKAKSTLTNIQQTLKEINLKYKDFEISGIGTEDALTKLVDEFANNQDKIKAALYDIRINVQQSHHVMAEQRKKIAAENEKNQQIQEKIFADLQKERDEFDAKRQQEDIEYKRTIEEKRKEREKHKEKEKKTRISSHPSALFHAEKPVEAIKVINVSMRDRLEQLSKNHLTLLLSILNQERKLKFTDVSNLITNQLGGKIKEIGNGSSHKRIELDAYCFDVYSNEEPLQECDAANTTKKDASASKNISALTEASVPVKAPSIVGGTWKPHGGDHNKGEMSLFNLYLVKQTFNKAGITLEVITDLQKRREQGQAEREIEELKCSK